MRLREKHNMDMDDDMQIDDEVLHEEDFYYTEVAGDEMESVLTSFRNLQTYSPFDISGTLPKPTAEVPIPVTCESSAIVSITSLIVAFI